jgi:hypothetical protein
MPTWPAPDDPHGLLANDVLATARDVYDHRRRCLRLHRPCDCMTCTADTFRAALVTVLAVSGMIGPGQAARLRERKVRAG